MSYGRERGLCDAPALGVTSQTLALSMQSLLSLCFTLLSPHLRLQPNLTYSASSPPFDYSLRESAQSVVEVISLPRLCCCWPASSVCVCVCVTAILARKARGHLLPVQSYIAIKRRSSFGAFHPPAFCSVESSSLAVTLQQSRDPTQEGSRLAFAMLCERANDNEMTTNDDDDDDGHSCSRKALWPT